MGKVIVPNVVLKNNEDVVEAKRGHINRDAIRTKNLAMIADTGARAVGLPLSIIEELGLPKMDEVTVTLSDGSKQRRTRYSNLIVQILNRESIFDCIAKPETAPCIFGQIVMEALDLVVDCPNQRVIPNPEAPEGMMLYEDY